MQFNNKIYWIKYPPGASGAFLALIAGQLLWPEQSQVEDFPVKAHADDRLDKYVKQCQVVIPKIKMITDFPVFDDNYLMQDHTIQDSIRWLPQGSEVVIPDHWPPTWDDCQVKFPNSQFLIITVSEQMRRRFYANVYHKRANRRVLGQGHVNMMENIWTNMPARRGLIKNLPVFDLPDWAVEILTENQCQDWPQDQVDHQTIWQPETRYSTNIEQTIWRVDLWRIIHDSEQLLQELAQWLGQPVNDIARSTWANYIQRQQELLPWLNDQ